MEKFRQKITTAPQEWKVSLSDIVKKYPELNDIPEKVINYSEDEIRFLDEDREKCIDCKKEGKELEECYYKEFNYYGEYLNTTTGKCKKQLHYYRLKKINRLLGDSRVGKRFLNRRFETFEINKSNKTAYNNCKKYSSEFDKTKSNGLILFGSYGTGKTHLAVAILHELIERDINGLFVTVPELLNEIRKDFNVDKESKKSELLESIKTAEFLILDDLGAEKTSDWVREQLFMIINARYENMLPTIITTNIKLLPANDKDIDNLESKVGARTVSRIIEMCNGIMLNGDDYRKNKLK